MRRLLWCALLLPAIAAAHLMPAGQGSVRLTDDSTWLAVAVPVDALQGWSGAADERITLAQLQANRDTLLAQLRQRISVAVTGQQGRTLYEDLLFESAQPGDTSTDQLLLLRHEIWTATPRSATLHVDLSGAHGDGALTLRALRGADTDVAVFGPGRREHTVFPDVLQQFSGFVGIGVAHILGGVDHLLFLLTVLVAGAGWRYWFSVVTSFTVAHSLTLACAMLGWLRLPPGIVEPAIAASIMLMAVHSLWRGAHAVRGRVALVFCCGLLHGLGFASALQELSGDGTRRWWSLAGFNVGVEIGQLAFAVTVLLAALAVRRLAPRGGSLLLARGACALAALAGGVLFVQRLP